MRAPLLLAALLATPLSCARDITLDVPLEASTKSVILAFETGVDVELFARSADPASGERMPGVLLPEDGDALVTALLYDASLIDLELEPGAVAIALPSEASRALPDFKRAYQSRISGSDAGAFTAISELDDALRQIRIRAPDRNACLGAGGCYPGQRACVTPCPPAPMPDGPEDPVPPELPRGIDPLAAPVLPASVVLAPCPSGWSTVPARAGDDASVATCEPFPAGLACASGQVLFPGEAACAAIGGLCPPGQYAPDLPAAGVLYVDPGASPGGDGSLARPLRSIFAATALALPGTTIALAKGSYDAEGGVVLPAGVSLAGACAESELVATSTFGAALVAGGVGTSASVRRLRVRALHDGIAAFDGASLEVEDVEVEGAEGAGLLVDEDSSMIARGAVVRGAGYGVFAGARGDLELTRVLFEGSRLASIALEHATARLDSVIARDPRGGDVSPYGEGLGSNTAAVEIRASVFERNLGEGLLLVAGTATITDTIVRGTRSASIAPGRGISAGGGAHLSLERVHISDCQSSGLYVGGNTVRVEARDLIVEGTRPREARRDGVGIVAGDSVRFSGARVLVRDNRVYGVGVLTGAQVTLDDLTVVETASTSTASFGFGLAMDGASRSTIHRARLARNQGNAIVASTQGTRAELEDITATDTRPTVLAYDGSGLIVTTGATVDLTRAVFERNPGRAIGVGGAGAVLSAQDLLVRGLGIAGSSVDPRGGDGLAVLDGGSAIVRRAVFEDNLHSSVYATQPMSAIDLQDARVAWTRETSLPNTAGIGGAATAALKLSRVLLEHNAGSDINAFDLRSAMFEDITCRDGEPDMQRGTAEGVILSAPQSASVARVRVEGAYGRAMAIAGGFLSLSDVSLHDVHRETKTFSLGNGLLLHAAIAHAERLEIDGAEATGVVFGDSLTLTATSVRVRGASSSGLEVSKGADLRLHRALFAENVGHGIEARDAHTIVRATDLEVSDTHVPPANIILLLQSGMIARGGAGLVLDRFVIRRTDNIGLTVEDGGVADLTRGSILHNSVGAEILTRDFEVRRLLDGVVFSENPVNLHQE